MFNITHHITVNGGGSEVAEGLRKAEKPARLDQSLGAKHLYKLVPSEQGRVYYVYCDESRQTKHRYMILAGAIVTAKDVSSIEKALIQCRHDTRMTAELKWAKVSHGKLDAYKHLVDCFVGLINADKLHFKAVIFDAYQVDHSRFSKGDHEEGFYKFYYQMLLHRFGKRYCKSENLARFLVFLDQRTTKYSLETLRNFLNQGMASRFAVTSSPFRKIEPKDSKMCDIIQLIDIITGAIGYQWNLLHQRKGANVAKVELAAHLARRLGWPHLLFETTAQARRFEIWKFQLQRRKAP